MTMEMAHLIVDVILAFAALAQVWVALRKR
jgi:hypothetical protein